MTIGARMGCIGPARAEAFAAKITELFATESPRTIFGETVRNFVIENYQWKKIANLYLAEIKKTVIETKN